MASSLGRTKPEVYIVTNQYKMGNVKECPWGIKMIKIETLYWKMVKDEEFNFSKVQTLLNSM